LYPEEKRLLDSIFTKAILLNTGNKSNILRQIQTSRHSLDTVIIALHVLYPVVPAMQIQDVRDCIATMGCPELSARLANTMLKYPQYFSKKKAKKLVNNYNKMVFEMRLINPSTCSPIPVS